MLDLWIGRSLRVVLLAGLSDRGGFCSFMLSGCV